MKKCKFNVGDEVVLNQNYDKFEVGTRAKVIKTDDNLVFCKTWDGKRLDCFDYRLGLVPKPVDPTSKLKIGDRVVLNRDLGKCRKGATGTIKSFGDYNATLKAHMVYATLDDKSTIGTYENRFDLVSETPKCKFKVGDRVKANEKSDKTYSCTNQRNKFTGEVVRVRSDEKVDIRHDRSSYVWSDLDSDCFDLIESTPEIHITVEGNKTVAVYKNGTETKEAVAKCSPEDTFDFGIGAKLALERLGVLPTDPVETTSVKLMCMSKDYGTCGTPTKFKDLRGEPLHVGDVVELIKLTEKKSYGDHVVVEDKYKKQFIMGIACDCTGNGEIKGNWVIIKHKSYSDMKPGDAVDFVKYV